MRVHLPLLCRALATFSAIPALAVFAERSDSDSLIIKLNTGTFRGARADNGTERWLGIPYAVPPLGELRFKAPVPLPSVTATVTIKNASQFGNACPQPPFFTAIDAPISEDCLVLNVSFRMLLLPEKMYSTMLREHRFGDPQERPGQQNCLFSYGSM